jgi:hypothetical protein
MTTRLGAVPDGDASVRWRAWQARGAAQDRRSAVTMRVVMLLIAVAIVIWTVMRLA